MATDDKRKRAFDRDYYWQVDLHGLTEQQAQSILEYASAKFGLTGSLVDPEEWHSVYMDQATAETTCAALRVLGENDIAQSFRETIEDWLAARRDGA